MASCRWTFQTILFSVGLAFAVIGLGLTLYYVEDPATRVGAGLLFLAAIIWAAGRLRVVEMVLESVRIEPAEERRRHRNLRSTVDLLIADVRRLNGLAIDATRGFRDSGAAMKEMETIENHMVDVIKQIRAKAGLTDQQLADRLIQEKKALEETPVEPESSAGG
ncbi:MAG TPA: hypothetical protein VK845_14260 [Gemmatimonadales bacterium]|nr:hypothetical protein [Gemmatimonadales bacterium]